MWPAHTLREYPNADVARLGRTLDRADGFIIVTPEYDHGYPASLKNAMDHTYMAPLQPKLAALVDDWLWWSTALGEYRPVGDERSHHLRQACEVIAGNRVVDVDLGLAGDNYFVNVTSAGLSVTTTQVLSSRLKKRAGALAYPVASVKAFLRHRPFSVRLHFPDDDHDPVHLDRMLQVAVGNGRFYGGGNVVAPDAGIDDHALDIYGIQMGRHRDLVGVARYFRSGDFIRRENVTHLTTRRVVLETEPPLPLNVDGEVVAHTPQEFRVARNALRVMVPEDSTAARLDT